MLDEGPPGFGAHFGHFLALFRTFCALGAFFRSMFGSPGVFFSFF